MMMQMQGTPQAPLAPPDSPGSRRVKLKSLFTRDLISEAVYIAREKEILSSIYLDNRLVDSTLLVRRGGGERKSRGYNRKENY